MTVAIVIERDMFFTRWAAIIIVVIVVVIVICFVVVVVVGAISDV